MQQQPGIFPLNDSLAALPSDTLQGIFPMPFLPWSGGKMEYLVTATLPANQRYEGIPHWNNLKYSSGIASFYLLCMFIIMLGYQGFAGHASQSLKQLFEAKERSSIFSEKEDQPLALKWLIQLQIILQLSYMAILHFAPAGSQAPFLPKLWIAFISVITLFIIGEYMLNYLLITTFSSERSFQLWRRGRETAFEILGILLFISSMLYTFGTFTKGVLNSLVFGAIGFYLAVMLLRGLKIFFRTTLSYFYLILYLCSAVLAPGLMLYELLGAIIKKVI